MGEVDGVSHTGDPDRRGRAVRLAGLFVCFALIGALIGVRLKNETPNGSAWFVIAGGLLGLVLGTVTEWISRWAMVRRWMARAITDRTVGDSERRIGNAIGVLCLAAFIVLEIGYRFPWHFDNWVFAVAKIPLFGLLLISGIRSVTAMKRRQYDEIFVQPRIFGLAVIASFLLWFFVSLFGGPAPI